MRYKIKEISKPRAGRDYLIELEVINPWYVRWFTKQETHLQWYMGSPTVFRKWKNGMWKRCGTEDEMWLTDLIFNHENKLGENNE